MYTTSKAMEMSVNRVHRCMSIIIMLNTTNVVGVAIA